MTQEELTIAKCLVAVAWADGTVKEPEQGMLEGLLWAFGAEPEQEAELLEYAKTKRKLSDAPVADLGPQARELCLAHAALLTHADGKQTKAEEKILKSLVELLGFSDDNAKQIIDHAKERAGK